MADQKRHAVIDDLFITRDDVGEVVPIEIESALLGSIISVVPVTYGYIKRMGLDMQISAVEWPTAKKLTFVQDHVKSPDMHGLTVKDVEERMGPMTLNHLVACVVSQSVPMNRLRQDVGPLAEALKRVLSKNDSETQSISSINSDTPT